MEISFTPTHAFCLVFLFFATPVSAQSPQSGGANFSCAARPTSSCDAYVAYVAQSPDFTSLKSVSDLFGIASSSIAEASSLVSEDVELIPGQLLLVPLGCGCNGSRYFANVTYTVKAGDNYYLLSTHAFENLADWHVAVDVNPALKPNSLQPGDKLVFPLFCGCPSEKSLSENGIRYLITYVWQPGDDVARVAAMFNTSEADIEAENKYRNFSAAAGSPVLIPVSRLPALSQPSPRRKNSLKHRWIAIAAISSAGAILISIVAILLVHALGLCQKRKSLDRKDSGLEKLGEGEDFEGWARQGKLLPGLSGYLGKPTVYDIQTIMEATMNLSEMCKVGGSVYKAMIDGKLLAVKKAKEDFTEELKILQKVNHGNLVNLLGISLDSGGACFFVFEFAENGSLDVWLRAGPGAGAGAGSGPLSWRQRLHVALDVAHGLQYMHEHAQPSLAHRGIRAGSVLLDAKLKAKISDFSRAGPAEAPSALKADVFAFGLVLLELLSGREAVPGDGDGEASERGREERVSEWIDPKLEGFYPIEGALSLMALAKACTQERPLSRPSMGEIVFSLSLLTQSFSEALEASSWNCTLEVEEELVQITSSITAR